MKTTPTIFIISTEFPPGPGGIGSHAFQLANQLFRLGWNVKVFCEQEFSSTDEVNSYNRNSPFPVIRIFPTPSMYLLLRKFIRLLFSIFLEQPGIIVGTGKHGSWFAYCLGKCTFRKVVLVGHGTEFAVTMSNQSKKINKHIYSKADALIYVSDYTKKIAEGTGINNPSMYVIHNGADDELFYRLSKEEMNNFRTINTLQNKKIIITVGNVQPRKGHEWVIRAMPQILKSVPNAHYYCVGMPTIKTKLEEIVKNLNIEQHVHFVGKVEQSALRAWLNIADVFAMTSIATDYGDVEGFGIAVIEAALCGVPAVVTNESGPGEAIVEGITGFGVKERDTIKIAERVITLLQNESLRTHMGNDAMLRAKKQLTWEIVVKKYEQVLSNLIY